jgi:hypothetical protein
VNVTFDQEARAALEAHATSKGHPSVEPWLRALTPQRLNHEVLNLILEAIGTLTLSEQSAAAEVFFAFAPSGPRPPAEDGSVFHPSLLEPDAFPGLCSDTLLLPKSLADPWLSVECK